MKGLDIGRTLRKIRGGTLANDIYNHMNRKTECQTSVEKKCSYTNNLKFFAYSAVSPSSLERTSIHLFPAWHHSLRSLLPPRSRPSGRSATWIPSLLCMCSSWAMAGCSDESDVLQVDLPSEWEWHTEQCDHFGDSWMCWQRLLPDRSAEELYGSVQAGYGNESGESLGRVPTSCSLVSRLEVSNRSQKTSKVVFPLSQKHETKSVFPSVPYISLSNVVNSLQLSEFQWCDYDILKGSAAFSPFSSVLLLAIFYVFTRWVLSSIRQLYRCPYLSLSLITVDHNIPFFELVLL